MPLKISMRSGSSFVFDDAKATNFTLEDIATHLSRVNRFVGATKLPISVAQHAVYVSALTDFWGCDVYTQLYALHHDDHEAIMSDMPTPVQHWIGGIAGWDVIEEAKQRLDAIIFPKMGLSWPPQPGIWEVVKRADSYAGAAEGGAYLDPRPDWIDGYKRSKGIENVIGIAPWNCVGEEEAREMYLYADKLLRSKLNDNKASVFDVAI